MIDKLAVALVRATPFGYFKLARLLARVRPSLRRFPVSTRYGTIVCDISERICFPLVLKGEYENWGKDEIAFARIPLTSSSVVLDIGANIGVTTNIFAERAGQVHAFEPSPRALGLLKANARSNVTVHSVALSDYHGVAFFEERDSLDISSFSDHGIEVPVRTVDSFDLKPDFIKIDVEGFEPQVLRGAKVTLGHSPVVMFEALSTEARDECEATILAANSGYRFETVSRYNHIAWPEAKN